MKKSEFNCGWKYGRLGEAWRKEVVLPHDAMIAEKRSENNAGGKNIGWFEGHDYVYEKTFVAPLEWQNKDVVFEFEGVYRNAKVYINGKYAGGRVYGYSNFYVQANAFLNYGHENEIRVEAFNADQPNSRWYTGAGIYRSVWVYELEKERIELNGVRIKTLNYLQPTVLAEVKTNAPGKIKVEVLDGEKVICVCEGQTDGEFSAEMVLENARLWSVEKPYLYTCRVTFGDDVTEEKFGVRVIECDVKNGFCINGQRVVLRGACVHHDNGLLGAVAHPFAEERKIRLLKENGYNAIRSAHNPCSKALLDACDKLGVLVVDEFVDMWYIHKNKYDYANDFESEWERDLRSLVEKDFNHPSVVMYSIGNEVAETAQKRGIELVKNMTEFLHSLDTRPVTCGINIFFNLLSSLGFGVYSDKKAESDFKAQNNKKKKKKAVGSEFFNNLAAKFGANTMKIGATMPGCGAKTKGAFAELDVAGYNYGVLRYRKDLKKYPNRVILGSETFCSDARKFWILAQAHPALIGDFVWAGIDYLGEVGLGAWEYRDYAPDFSGGENWIAAGSGRLDVTGKPWGEASYTKVAFGLEPIRIAVVRPDKAKEMHSPAAWRMSNALESWSWEGCDGKKAKVEVYATGHKVELILNGKRVAKKKVPANARVSFWVKYAAGELVANSLDKKGNVIATTSLKSAGEQTLLTLSPEQEVVKKNELCYVRLQYTDDNGTVKPLARGDIKVSVEGGELLALGNGCPYNERGYVTDITDTYYGEALAIIRPDSDKVIISAQSVYGNVNKQVDCER